MALLPEFEDIRIGVIGLGYVGLPLAVYLAQKFNVTGFDVNAARISDLQQGIDQTCEVTDQEFKAAKTIAYSDQIDDLRACNFYIVTVPTPINHANQPDLTALQKASATVGKVLAPGNIVVYESTVYPGATEEICVPILEQTSGLKLNQDFYAGYSPERINPGDHDHRLPSITKVTSGSTPEAADLINQVYASIITAGTHKAGSIKIAESAKVIENIQRDVNIALINELAMLFKRMNLPTLEVLEAAGTKWNFLPFRPGLVGGHCIGVDPYYLTHKAQSIGFHPEMILAGRRINDGMAQFVALDILKAMINKKIEAHRARILVLGFTFKENCPDIRNTKIAELVREISDFAGEVVIYDPLASPEEVRSEYGLALTRHLPEDGPFDVLVFAVGHREIAERALSEYQALLPDNAAAGLIYDIKNILPEGVADRRL